MSQSPEDKAAATVQQADQMIAAIKRQLEDGEDFLRKQGLNPDKVREVSAKGMSAEDKRKLDELIRQDAEAVEDEVAQARLHADSGTGATIKSKRPRSMV